MRANSNDARYPANRGRHAWREAAHQRHACLDAGPKRMFSPFLRELKEMRFQWDRPYQVDASRFKAAFWSDVTPFETGVPETALAFGADSKQRR